ncbi:unnamed protein product [Closterium sp. NIES-54]
MTGAGSISSIGLACLFDAHALRWRLVKLRQGVPGGNGDRDARTPRSRCHECLEEARWSSRERLWTTDDPPRLDADEPPGLKIDDPPRRHADDPPRAETWARGSDSSPSDPPPSPSPPPPALAGAAEAEARTAAAAEAAGEGRHVAPFLVDELMGMEQLSRVTAIHDVGYYHCSHLCDDPESSRSLIDPDYVSPLPLPDGLRARLEQLLSRHPQHVSALHMPVTVDYCSGRSWQIREMMGLARSCVNLRSLHLVSEPPRYASCPIHLAKPSVWGWKEQAQKEQMRELITSCPHLRSLHFSLCSNNYLTMSEEVAALLSRLSHLSLPLSDLPPYLLPHLSSLRSLCLSLSAPHHPLLLSARPFHSLSRLYLLHLSLGSPTAGLSEPLSPDLFAGLGPSLLTLTFLVCATPTGAEEKRGKRRGEGAQGGGGRVGGIGESVEGGGGEEEEGGGWVEDGWGGEDEVVGWLPASLWSLTRLQQLTTNVGGEWHCTGLNALFPPHASLSSSCYCCCSSSSVNDDSTHPHQSPRQCLAALPNLTSLYLLAHRNLPPCLSSLSSLTLLSIPLASPLHCPASLALFAHWPRLSHLHVNGEGPAEPTFCHAELGTGHTKPPLCPPSSYSLRHVTLTGTAGVIPLAVWGRLCPQLQSLKIQGSPLVAVQGWGALGSPAVAVLGWGEASGEALSEANGEGDVGKGACGAGGAAETAAVCFFPFLEELVLHNVRSHAGCHTEQGHAGPQQQQQSLAFMGMLPRLTHLAIQDSPWPSHSPMHAPTILPHLLPNLTFLRIHSPPPAPLPVLSHLRTLIVGSYPHSSRFLAALALFPALTALRIFNLSMHNYHSALSCPPHLKSLQICHSHTPLLPDCLRLFSSLTRLHLFQCTPLRALPSFLSSFSSLTHFAFDRPYNPVVVPVGLEGYLQGREWAREQEEEQKGKGKPKKKKETKEERKRKMRFQSVFQSEEESMLSWKQKEEQREWWRQVGRKEEEQWEWRCEGVRGEGQDAQQQQEEEQEQEQEEEPWQEAEQGGELVQGVQEVEVRGSCKDASDSNHDSHDQWAEQQQQLLPPEEVLAGVLQQWQSSSSISTPSSTQVVQLPWEVLQGVLQRVQSPVEQARVRLVCREWHHCCRLHTSCFALALHPLTLSWLPITLLHPPRSTSSSSKPVCSMTSHHQTREAGGLNGSPLFSSAWFPSDSPFWLIHSSPTSPFSLLTSSRPPFTLAPHITPSSLSTCFTHYLSTEEHHSPVWFASLPSPSSLAHTLAHYPNLSTLALPLVSTTAWPLRPSHLRSLLAAAAALPALTSLSLLLEPGFLPEYKCGYGRQDWQDDWWEADGVEVNQEMERGLFAVLKRCRGLKQLCIQGQTLTNRLKLPQYLFLRCSQLTALSLPLSRLPSSLLLLSRLTSLALALPADPMPPRLSLPSPFAHLRSLRSLSLHVQNTLSFQHTCMDGSSWSSVSDDLLLGLPSCLSALSLHLPTSTMPSSSCLTSLTCLDTNLRIPGLDEDDEEEEEEEGEGVGEEEEREVMAEEARNVGEDEGGCVIADGDVCDDEEEEEQSNGFANAGVASRIIDESLLPLCNLTSLSLPHYRCFPPLIRHLTRLTSLALPSLHRAYDYGDNNTPSCSLHYGLSRLTRLEDLFLSCSDSACLPRLPRLRRLRVQCPDETVDVARFIARVAPSLEQLDIRADRFRYASAYLSGWRTDSGEWTAPVFQKLKVLQLLANSGPSSNVDMSLFPALEHMALSGSRYVSWKVENGFSANLRFLHLDRAKLSGYESDRQLTQLTALTTLVVDNADCRDFLACLSCFSSLHTLRLSNITRGLSQPYLTCPPRLATLQICRCDLLHLPSSLLKFSRLTRLDLLHWRRLHSLPPFLSAFTSLRHFRLTADGPMPHVPPCLEEFLKGKEWYEHSSCDGSFEN